MECVQVATSGSPAEKEETDLGPGSTGLGEGHGKNKSRRDHRFWWEGASTKTNYLVQVLSATHTTPSNTPGKQCVTILNTSSSGELPVSQGSPFHL